MSCVPLDAICIAAAIDRSVRCGVASGAEVHRAEVDRTDAGRGNIRIRCVRHKPKTVVFCLGESLANFRAGLLLR